MMFSVPARLAPFARATAGLAAVLLAAAPAAALTVVGLKDTNAEWAAGDYAPAGKCAGQPRITLTQTGFVFVANGQTLRPAASEWAPDYVRDADGSKATWFFPFKQSEEDYGPIVMALTRDAKGVTLELDNNAGTRLQGAYAALLAGSPYRLCGRATAAAASPRAESPVRQPAAASAQPLEWTNLAQAAGGQGGYDMLARGGIATALRALLGPKMAVLENNLSVSTPLGRDGRVFYLSGNAEHRGGYDMAYVLLDPAQRAIEVGLWEGGKLTIRRSPGRPIPLPAEIARLRAEQPPEEAVAAPGPPWELRPVEGHTPLAFGTPAASPHLDTMSLYCDSGRAWIGAKFYRDPGVLAVTLSIGLMGRFIDVALHPVNATRTMWIADIGQSPLVRTMIAFSREPAILRVNGGQEGEITMGGIGPVAKAALGSCLRL